jgi:predicted transcriptional regulator of viral defense system
MKYVDDFVKNFNSQKFPVFTKSDAYLFLTKYRVSEGYAKRFLNNLVRSGKIYRIKRNYYTCHSSPYVVGFAFAPFYYGLGTALNIHDVTEQQSQPTVISATKSMPRVLLFRGAKVFIHRIKASMLFGIATFPFEGFDIPVSDIEKTLIDLVYFGYVVDDYVYENAVKAADKKKLNRYLGLCGMRIRKSVRELVAEYG